VQEALQILLDLLQLDPLGDDCFLGQSQDLGWGSIFGGQVLGQGLYAANQTVPDDRFAHSLHAYFLRRGDVEEPVRFEVDRSRDGRSFTTRRVVALQHGKPILHMSASFQVDEEGLEHQVEAPEIRGPEGLDSEQELALRFSEMLPERLRKPATAERAIEVRHLDPLAQFDPQPREPQRQIWCRANDALPDDRRLHQCLLAYASDFALLSTAMLPHAVHWTQPDIQVASLDHSLWFHRPFRMDRWLSQDIVSPNSSGARGLVMGRFFDQEGSLIASSAQQGLIRDHRAGTP